MFILYKKDAPGAAQGEVKNVRDDQAEVLIKIGHAKKVSKKDAAVYQQIDDLEQAQIKLGRALAQSEAELHSIHDQLSVHQDTLPLIDQRIEEAQAALKANAELQDMLRREVDPEYARQKADAKDQTESAAAQEQAGADADADADQAQVDADQDSAADKG